MAFYHGVKTSEQATALSAPVKVENGITFAVGTAPVHSVGGEANKIVLAESYAEAVKALGYSKEWDKYTLCEVMKTHFELYKTGPVVFVNVLDPAKHRKANAGEEYKLGSDGTVILPFDTIADTVTVKESEGEGTVYALDTDYTLTYSDSGLILEKTAGSTISGSTIYVESFSVDASAVSENDIIGGVSVADGSKSGLELLDGVLTCTGIVPEFIIAPGFSENVNVAAAMSLKAAAINELFEGKAITDMDTVSLRNATDACKSKEAVGGSSSNQIICYPNVGLGGVRYHLSAHIAALMAVVDGQNEGVPSASPSNKALNIDSIILADGAEINLELAEANRLNSMGIVTALNFIGGFKAWGNYTACYPDDNDPKNYFISVNRMFAYVAKILIFTHWSQIDSKMTPRLFEAITDSVNIWMNGLTADNHLLGGRVEFISGENPLEALMAGKIKFHVYITPPSPATEIEFTLEYDTAYAQALFE